MLITDCRYSSCINLYMYIPTWMLVWCTFACTYVCAIRKMYLRLYLYVRMYVCVSMCLCTCISAYPPGFLCTYVYAVEPLYQGHFGTLLYVLITEVSSIQRSLNIYTTVLHWDTVWCPCYENFLNSEVCVREVPMYSLAEWYSQKY